MDGINSDAVYRVETYVMFMKHTGHWSDGDVKSFAYRQWAAREIISLLKCNIDYTPIDVIENFIDKMERYKSMNSINSFIFSEAIIVAEDIMSYILK